MTLTYATVTDLEDVLPDITDVPTLTRRIEVASRWVRSATRAAIYDTTPTGLPEDEDLRDAMRDAVVEQIRVWHATGIDPDRGVVGSAEGVVARKSLRTASIDYAVHADSAKDRAAVATQLAPTAYQILEDAGLTGGPVQTFGGW